MTQNISNSAKPMVIKASQVGETEGYNDVDAVVKAAVTKRHTRAFTYRFSFLSEIKRNIRLRMPKTCLIIVVLFLVSCMVTQNDAAIATGFKYCLYECANCIELWGNLYDGEKCATCCRYSNGVKVDPQCKVWVSKRVGYTKKDRDYVNGILVQRRRSDSGYFSKKWDENINYNSIFGNDEMPSYCFE